MSEDKTGEVNPFKHNIGQVNNSLPEPRQIKTQGGNKLAAMLAGGKSSGVQHQAEKVVTSAQESQDVQMIPFSEGELKFVKHIIPAAEIKDKTYIDNATNGRNKELVTAQNVSALTAAIRNRTQLQPAYGFRGSDGLIEIIDGQRRSLACYEAGKDFTIYVCDGEYPLSVKRDLRKELQLAREHSWYDLGVEVLYHEANSGEDGEKLTGKLIAKIMGISEAKISRARKAVGIPLSLLKSFYDHNLLSIENYNILDEFVSACSQEVSISELSEIDGLSSMATTIITEGKVSIDELVAQLSQTDLDTSPLYGVIATKLAMEFAVDEPVVQEGLQDGQQIDDDKVTLEQLHQLQLNAIIDGANLVVKAIKKDGKPKKAPVVKTDFLKGAEDLKSNRRWKAQATWEQGESEGTKQKNGSGVIKLGNIPPDVWDEVGEAVQAILHKRSKKGATEASDK